MFLVHKNIEEFFNEILFDIECRNNTRAYIISIFSKYRTSQFDLSKNSITILYSQAINNQDFYLYQTIGDWLFFASTWAPEHLNNVSADYYHNIAKLSYYSCYNLINKKWDCFEELANKFLHLEERVKNKLSTIKCQDINL